MTPAQLKDRCQLLIDSGIGDKEISKIDIDDGIGTFEFITPIPIEKITGKKVLNFLGEKHILK